jgi:hypothetical protein
MMAGARHENEEEPSQQSGVDNANHRLVDAERMFPKCHRKFPECHRMFPECLRMRTLGTPLGPNIRGSVRYFILKIYLFVCFRFC